MDLIQVKPYTVSFLALLFCACSGEFQSGKLDGGSGYGDGGSPGYDFAGPYVPGRPTCNGRESTISGTVLAPNGVDPVPGATVFVPSKVPELFVPEVQCEVCGQLGMAANFWQTTTAYDGTFSLTVCPGDVDLILQNGRFRRFLQIDLPEKQAVELTAAQSRLPRRQAEFHALDAIPRIAVATGNYDKMECVLHKLGLESGAIDLYEAATGIQKSPDPLISFGELVRNPEKMKTYNIIFINCTNNEHEQALRDAVVRDNLHAYVKAGGRLYVTDWSYDWIEQVPAFSPSIDFEPGVSDDQPEPFNGAALGDYGLQVEGQIKDSQMANWLGLFPGAISNNRSTIEHFLGSWVMMHKLDAEAKLWVEGKVSSAMSNIDDVRPLTVTFNFESCGKILFSSYHTEGREDEVWSASFPEYCGSTSSPQDRILEYLIFDIASCVGPLK
jgi:hypothetical protein